VQSTNRGASSATATVATTTNATTTKTSTTAVEAATRDEPTVTHPLQTGTLAQITSTDFSRAVLTPPAASAVATIQLRPTGAVVVLPVTGPPGPEPKLTLTRGAMMIAAGLGAPRAQQSPPSDAGAHGSSRERPPTATSSTPPATTQPTPPVTTQPTALATTRPAPLATTPSSPLTTGRPLRHPASGASLSTPSVTQAVSLPRLGHGPVPGSLRTEVLAVLAGIFALTVLLQVANRSLPISRTFRGASAARWLPRLELLPWLSGMLFVGVAIILWLLARS
jgi:hypothetical protein